MDYPATATKVRFKPIGDRAYIYRVWKSGSRWAWFALGNSGIADNMEEAMRKAREYILMGVGGIARESRQVSDLHC